MSQPVLLIFSEAPGDGHPGLAVPRSLERLGVPAVCFMARLGALGNGTFSAFDAGRVRWAENDPALRWVALKSLLNHARFDAVGFIGPAAFREFSERLDDHAGLPGFIHLSDDEIAPFLAERGAWLRGTGNLRLVLASSRRGLRRLEACLPGSRPFRLASLDRDRVWPPLLRRPRRTKPALASLITPVFNRLAYTERCVQSVLAETKGPFEWWIIDNGSTDGTRRALSRWARKDSRIRVLRNAENLGFARAVNQGLRRARGETLVLLNNDTIVGPGWLEGLQSCLDRDPGLGAVGPCTNEAADLHQHRRAAYRLDRFDVFAAAWSLRHRARVLQMPRLIGFCLAVRRAAFLQAGLLDERFHVGGYEDYDYCLRLRQAGWRLGLAEEVFIHHFGHVSYADPASRNETIASNRSIFLDKWTRKSLEFLDNLAELRREPTLTA